MTNTVNSFQFDKLWHYQLLYEYQPWVQNPYFKSRVHCANKVKFLSDTGLGKNVITLHSVIELMILRRKLKKCLLQNM